MVANVCLNLLRARRARRDQPMGVRLPDPIGSPDDSVGLDDEEVLADSVELALLVLLDRLTPPERLAFVLHDLFAVPYDEIATSSDDRRPPPGSTPAGPPPSPGIRPAARHRPRQPAARGRRLPRRHRNGDLEALMAVLDPDVTLRGDIGGGRPQASREVRGAANVSQLAVAYSHPRQLVTPVLVNGNAGLLTTQHGRPVSLLAFTVQDGKITQIDVLADPDRLRQLDLAALAR